MEEQHRIAQEVIIHLKENWEKEKETLLRQQEKLIEQKLREQEEVLKQKLKVSVLGTGKCQKDRVGSWVLRTEKTNLKHRSDPRENLND